MIVSTVVRHIPAKNSQEHRQHLLDGVLVKEKVPIPSVGGFVVASGINIAAAIQSMYED